VFHLSFAVHVPNFLHPDLSLSGGFQKKWGTPNSATLDLAPLLGNRLARLDDDVTLPAEGHLQRLAAAAAHYRPDATGIDPDVHGHPCSPQDDGLGATEGRRARNVKCHRLTLGRDGDVPGALRDTLYRPPVIAAV
jgi:hypothetical protein